MTNSFTENVSAGTMKMKEGSIKVRLLQTLYFVFESFRKNKQLHLNTCNKLKTKTIQLATNPTPANDIIPFMVHQMLEHSSKMSIGHLDRRWFIVS